MAKLTGKQKNKVHGCRESPVLQKRFPKRLQTEADKPG